MFSHCTFKVTALIQDSIHTCGDLFPELTQNAAAAIAIVGNLDSIKVARFYLNYSIEEFTIQLFARLCWGILILYDDDTDVQSLPSTAWFKGLKHNEGGYDAIYIDKNQGLIWFIQVTNKATSTFKIEYFYEYLSSGITIQLLSNFTLSEVSGNGLLSCYGWNQGDERAMVRVVGWHRCC
ncbi:hypothetical protein THRCLA_21406 [Thraustotheca clavata]|uniref:Uncharacterized protein n=1 Tax=Thraustotheca clavata TaxID=74557 RepID=A0A1V9ZWU2_9STRA|nr:hypothetical protein THRCLA_21406 [Thraustotheca clavata]